MGTDCSPNESARKSSETESSESSQEKTVFALYNKDEQPLFLIQALKRLNEHLKQKKYNLKIQLVNKDEIDLSKKNLGIIFIPGVRAEPINLAEMAKKENQNKNFFLALGYGLKPANSFILPGKYHALLYFQDDGKKGFSFNEDELDNVCQELSKFFK